MSCPAGRKRLWRDPPFSPRADDGWLFGCVRFNAVLEKECTGNGTLASVSAMREAINATRLAAFEVVVIPEPLGERLMSAQVGVLWLSIDVTGRPAHAAYMSTGVGAVEAPRRASPLASRRRSPVSAAVLHRRSAAKASMLPAASSTSTVRRCSAWPPRTTP